VQIGKKPKKIAVVGKQFVAAGYHEPLAGKKMKHISCPECGNHFKFINIVFYNQIIGIYCKHCRVGFKIRSTWTEYFKFLSMQAFTFFIISIASYFFLNKLIPEWGAITLAFLFGYTTNIYIAFLINVREFERKINAKSLLTN